MVIGLLPLLNLDTCISNLEELDVPADKISVVAHSPAIQANFAQFTGSLHNTPANQLLQKLTQLAVPKAQANQLVHSLDNQSALVAVDLQFQDWLIRSFHDHAAAHIWSNDAP